MICFWKSLCDSVLTVTVSPDFDLNAATIAAIPDFGTGSDALDPRVVDFELLLPLLVPVHAASSGRPATPAAPNAAPLRTVRRLGVFGAVGVADIDGLLGDVTRVAGVENPS